MRKRLLLGWLVIPSLLALIFPIYFSLRSSQKTFATLSTPKTLTGNVPEIVAQGLAHLVGHYPGNTYLSFAIGLRLRNKQAIDQFLREVTDPHSLDFAGLSNSPKGGEKEEVFL